MLQSDAFFCILIFSCCGGGADAPTSDIIVKEVDRIVYIHNSCIFQQLSFRPVGIAYNKDESALYIASIGKVEVRTTLPNKGTPLPILSLVHIQIPK